MPPISYVIDSREKSNFIGKFITKYVAGTSAKCGKIIDTKSEALYTGAAIGVDAQQAQQRLEESPAPLTYPESYEITTMAWTTNRE